MFPDFDQSLFDDPEFKEDAVREVIISPILSRLGYTPSGENKVVRSKSLTHPFIYAGTRKVPVKLIPDYTLKSGERVVLILDAKHPREDLLSIESVQQVYSYAIHPEIKSEHFALCNGRRLVVFSVDQSDPLLNLEYTDFEGEWDEIVRYLSPKMLREPILRQFEPDFGVALARLGLAEGSSVIFSRAGFNLVMRLDEKNYSASANVGLAEKSYCVSFDFESEHLPLILEGLPDVLADAFSSALHRVPFQAAAELAIQVDLRAELGPEIDVDTEVFRPMIVKEVISSYFDPTPLVKEATDIPSQVFRLRRAFELKS